MHLSWPFMATGTSGAGELVLGQLSSACQRQGVRDRLRQRLGWGLGPHERDQVLLCFLPASNAKIL